MVWWLAATVLFGLLIAVLFAIGLPAAFASSRHQCGRRMVWLGGDPA
jgi:hypothetical protein